MKLETSRRPSSWWLPWGHLFQLLDWPDKKACLQGPPSGATRQDTGQNTDLYLAATRTLSTMWPEWILEDDCPSLSLQGRSDSYSHSQQNEDLTHLLGLAAEDWCSPGTLTPFKITSEEPRITIQVSGEPQSPSWCYLTSQVSFILHRSPWWGWMVSATSQERKTVLFKLKILIKVNFKIQVTK
jgi:hypothetical protein